MVATSARYLEVSSLSRHACGIPPKSSNGARIEVSRLEIIIFDPAFVNKMKDYDTPFSDQSGSSTPILWDPFQEVQMAASYNEVCLHFTFAPHWGSFLPITEFATYLKLLSQLPNFQPIFGLILRIYCQWENIGNNHEG